MPVPWLLGGGQSRTQGLSTHLPRLLLSPLIGHFRGVCVCLSLSSVPVFQISSLYCETIKGPSEASLALTSLRPTSGLTLMTDLVYMTYFLEMHEILAKAQEASKDKGIISGCSSAGV